MLKHEQIWRAIDRLAQTHGLSTSGLARKAGLDPTAFNRSKRSSGDGKLRWPSTESVAKVLVATQTSLRAFVALADDDGEPADMRRLPILGFAHAAGDGNFDAAGRPSGQQWDELVWPELGDPHAYALEISGDSMEPAYRDGDVIIITPDADCRRGDRVVVMTRDGRVLAKELLRRTGTRVELRALNPDYQDLMLPLDEIAWMSRIRWVSQ